MKKKHFDEYQVMKRYKIGYQSFFLIVVLIAVNISVSKKYAWADPDVQLYFIIMLALTYFAAMAIFKNAYLSNRTKRPIFYAVFLTVFGVYALKAHIFGLSEAGMGYIFENGQLTRNSASMIYPVFLMSAGTMFMAKYFIEKIKESKE